MMPRLPRELQQYILTLALFLQLKTGLPFKLLDDRRFISWLRLVERFSIIKARSDVSPEDKIRKLNMSDDRYDIEYAALCIMDTRQLADTS